VVEKLKSDAKIAAAAASETVPAAKAAAPAGWSRKTSAARQKSKSRIARMISS
jgi:hypothetical protein